MTDIQSNSQESSLKDRISKLSNNTTITKSVIDYLDNIVYVNSLDYERLAEKILTAIDKTPTINSIYGFVKSVADRAVNECSADLKKKYLRPMFTDLHLAIDALGFEGKSWHKFYIDMIEQHCINQFPVSPEELTGTNHAILDYCKSKNLSRYEDFINLLLRSKAAKKCNLPLQQFETKAKRLAEEWEEYVKEEVEEDVF